VLVAKFAAPAEFTRAFSAAGRPRPRRQAKRTSEFRKPAASLILIFPAATATATRTRCSASIATTPLLLLFAILAAT
jgi:hypothetical protein